MCRRTRAGRPAGETDVIAVEMRKQEGIDGCKSAGIETPLGVAPDPLAGTTLA